MFIKGNTVYSDPGKLLVSDSFVGYQCEAGGISGLHEEDIVIDDMRISGKGKFLTYSGGKIKQIYFPEYDKKDWKTEIIKSRYSNDDQIALILNKDKSEEAKILFDKMQEWRDWATLLSEKIISLKQ